MGKLEFHSRKTLKLMNVLKCKADLTDENFDLNICVDQMRTYIRTKGYVQIGPLIQYTRTFVNDENELDMEISLMMQSNQFIHNVENPYEMESVIRIPDAMYCRFHGDESKLKFAYDKINIEAYENDDELDDCSYTIFLDSDDDSDIMTADIFVPRVLAGAMYEKTV